MIFRWNIRFQLSYAWWRSIKSGNFPDILTIFRQLLIFSPHFSLIFWEFPDYINLVNDGLWLSQTAATIGQTFTDHRTIWVLGFMYAWKKHIYKIFTFVLKTKYEKNILLNKLILIILFLNLILFTTKYIKT